MKVNKIFSGLAAACALTIVALFSACASTDDSVKEVVFDSEKPDLTDALEPSEEEELDIDESNAIVVSTQEEAAFQIEATAGAARESKKNYTGWISSSIRPITNVKGNIKFYARPKKGTFALFVMNADEKAIPVISSANEYTTSSFYLKAGKKIIKLCDDSSVVSAAKRTEKGIKIRYAIDKVAVVIIDFEAISTKEGEPEDTVKVTASILSQSKKKTDFALKFICDTVLGETDRHHFYTSQNLPVKNEVLYHSMQEEKWFLSKNAKAAMQFILDGEGISPVESLALANFATLNTGKWEADMTSFRSFDTVLSYNNSAVGIYWPKSTLANEETCSDVFYISLAADGALPGGAAYLIPVETEAEEEEAAADAGQDSAQTKEETDAGQQDVVQNIQAVKEEELPAEPVKETIKETPADTAKEEAPVKEAEAEPIKTQNVSAVQEITNDKLSVDYIQKLLDRIEELEEGDPSVNKDEINKLNSELDAILTILNAQ